MPTSRTRRPGRAHGFTFIEVMVVVAIIGILALIAVPLFRTYQFRSKSAEAKTTLGSIRVLEHSYFSEHDTFLAAAPEPAVIPGTTSTDFVQNADFALLGFRPDGRVYFSYGVAISADGAGYTADAGADIDGNGFPQFWGFAAPDGAGTLVPGQVGCDVTTITREQIGPCHPTHGVSVF